MKRRRALKLETRYAYLLRDAKTLTVMLEIVSGKFYAIAKGFAPQAVLKGFV